MFDFLSSKFSSIFSAVRGTKQLTEETIQKTLASVQDALLEADVPYDVVQQFISEIKQEAVGAKLTGSLKPDEMLMKIVYDKLVQFLGGASTSAQEAAFTFDIPSMVMVMGLQGSGKTTTVAKLGYYIKDTAAKRGKSRRVLAASVDFYRPAAIDQLEIISRQAGIDFYRALHEQPVKAAEEITLYAQKNQYEIVLLDTAGRLHIDNDMLQELKKIDSLLSPKYKFLVLDAMTGQESLAVARAFDQALGFRGAILTKMDSEARAGSAFAFRYALKKPVIFAGTGEKIADFELFRPERMASRILGMGDILTLVEKAEAKIAQDEQKRLSSAFEQGKLTLQDFADQLDMMSRLGSLSTLIKYVPGASGLSISPEMLSKGEKELKKFKAIISSMTRKERLSPKLLNPSRKGRIARGAGVAVSDIDLLLAKFEQSQQFVKLFKKMGKLNVSSS
jgi:signal recognition particle subunit SRP54